MPDGTQQLTGSQTVWSRRFQGLCWPGGHCHGHGQAPGHTPCSAYCVVSTLPAALHSGCVGSGCTCDTTTYVNVVATTDLGTSALLCHLNAPSAFLMSPPTRLPTPDGKARGSHKVDQSENRSPSQNKSISQEANMKRSTYTTKVNANLHEQSLDSVRRTSPPTRTKNTRLVHKHQNNNNDNNNNNNNNKTSITTESYNR